MDAFASSSPSLQSTPPPNSVSRSLPWFPGKPCAQSGWLFPEDAAFMSSLTNPITSYLWVTLLAPTSPSLRLRGQVSDAHSHSCFTDLFVHARSNGISIVHPDLQLKSVTHTLISFVWERVYTGVEITGQPKVSFLRLLVETTCWLRQALTGLELS